MPQFAPPFRLGTLPPLQVAQTRGGRLGYIVSGSGQAALRELLGYAGLQPPYVLVGHSLGGLYASLFARLHRTQPQLALQVLERLVRRLG